MENAFFDRAQSLLAIIRKYSLPEKIVNELEHLASRDLRRVWQCMDFRSKRKALYTADCLFIREPCLGYECWEQLSDEDKPVWTAFSQNLIDLNVKIEIQDTLTQESVKPDSSPKRDLTQEEGAIAAALAVFGKPSNLPIQHLSDILYFQSEFNNRRWALLSSVDKLLWLSKYQKPDVATLILEYKGGEQLIEAINAYLETDEFKGIKI